MSKETYGKVKKTILERVSTFSLDPKSYLYLDLYQSIGTRQGQDVCVFVTGITENWFSGVVCAGELEWVNARALPTKKQALARAQILIDYLLRDGRTWRYEVPPIEIRESLELRPRGGAKPGAGRPVRLRPCVWCGQEMGTVRLSVHMPECRRAREVGSVVESA